MATPGLLHKVVFPKNPITALRFPFFMNGNTKNCSDIPSFKWIFQGPGFQNNMRMARIVYRIAGSSWWARLKLVVTAWLN